MATIGAINVVLSASSAAFSSGLKKARTELKQFTSFVTSTKTLLTGALALTGIGLSAAAIKSFVGGQMDAIDAVAKLSDRLGIATENLVGLQHAAALAGVSNEELTIGLDKLQREAVDPLDVALDRIADQIANTADANERGRIAFEAFGKSGQKLIPLLLGGSRGLREAREEAQKLGLTFSRLDAAKVEMANDAITKLEASFAGAGRTLAIELAPFITAAADKLTAMATAGEGVGNSISRAFESVAVTIAKTVDLLHLAEAGLHNFRAAVLQLTPNGGGGADKIQNQIEQLQGVLELSSPNSAKHKEIKDTIARLQKERDAAIASGNVGEVTKEINAAKAAMKNFTEGAGTKETLAFFESVRKASAEAAQAIADAAKNTGKLKDAVPGLGLPSRRQLLARGEFKSLVPDNGPTRFAAAIERRFGFTTPAQSRNDDPINKVAKNTADTADATEKSATHLDKIEKKLSASASVAVFNID